MHFYLLVSDSLLFLFVDLYSHHNRLDSKSNHNDGEDNTKHDFRKLIVYEAASYDSDYHEGYHESGQCEIIDAFLCPHRMFLLSVNDELNKRGRAYGHM